MEAVLLIVSIILMFVGFFGYNSLRRKWAGIVGVGGSYIIFLGIMLLVMMVGSLIMAIGGKLGGVDVGELIITVIFMVLCLLYTVYIMIARCETAAQRIMLPFVACFIAFGFCWRLLAAVVFHVPMESGKQEEFTFPQYIYDANENPWELMNSGGDNANYYCQKTGETRMFYDSDFDLGAPSGFHRR